MKVIFLSQRVPHPPDRGDRITTCHLVQHLLHSGAEVRVGCLCEDERDRASAQEIGAKEVFAPRIARAVRKLASLRGLLSGEALTLPFFRCRALQARVNRWLVEDPPDLVHVYSSSMAQYVMSRQARAHPTSVRLMQFAELDSDKWAQLAAHGRGPARAIYRREARLLLEFERRVARDFDRSLVVSECDRRLFTERIPGIEPAVLPNGVDVGAFTRQDETARHPHTLIFTGVMSYTPNVEGVLWFVAHCWAKVRARIPDARFLIVGSAPTAAIQRLARLAGIEVTGRVPRTQPFFEQAAVAIAPLHLARGVQNKVLEAMSMGLPVVATPQAVQGLGTLPDGLLEIAKEPQAFTAATCRLLADEPAARAMGHRAQAFVRAHFRWEEVYALYDRIVEECLRDRAKAGACLEART